ncbi:MAG: glycosyltransferase [Acidobacteria bacterium]|nr:glycosyltransferase [Acidobacteriota bacterium]
MLPAVSIIMPCYNQGHFLAQAIQSVQDQTFKNWELIIVNDGSSDDTEQVVHGFQDPRIRYIYQNNRGLSAARNAGIRATQALFIALLDSDDLWEPPFLERMLECLDRNPHAAAAYCGYVFIDEHGNKIGNPCLKTVPPQDFRRTLLNEGNWLVPSAVVCRKHSMEQAGSFDESLGGVADTDLWIRLCKQKTFVGVNSILIRYRLHEASMSRDAERMVSDFQRLTAKICGPLEGDPRYWEQSKKDLYAGLFQYAARKYAAAGNMKMSAKYFIQLYCLSACLALGMGLWRTFARLHLPQQHQGRSFSSEDFIEAESNLAIILDEIANLASGWNLLRVDLNRIRSRAFLAMAEEGVCARSRSLTCIWLWRAAIASPKILCSKPYWGTLVRLSGLVGHVGV